MPLPHCPAKYGSRAIVTARRAIEAGRQGARPDCPLDLILLYQKSLWRELNAAAVRKEAGDRAPFIVLDRGDAPVAVAGGFGVGAPAAVVCVEMCVALGVRRVVVVGYAGALQPELQPGDVLGVDTLGEVQAVDVTGTTKGRGFSGSIKRHGHHRGPETHGSKNVRASGSIGMHTFPGRVFPGKAMPGQYGAKRETKKNLKVMHVDTERNLIMVKGSVPGHKNGIVFIRPSR